MELIIKLLTWLLTGGIVLTVVLVIACVVSFAIFGRCFFKEYKKIKDYRANHAKKMAEMKKDFEEQQRENKRKMNRFR